MADTQSPLVRLGFELVERNVTLSGPVPRPYRGVERMYYFPNPFELSGEAEQAWSAYDDADENGALRNDPGVAERIRDPLASIGKDLEVIYSEVILLPDETSVQPEALAHPLRRQYLDGLLKRTSRVPPPPTGFAPIGLDVSTPNPTYHSPIFNGAPGVDSYEELRSQLNDAGLLDDATHATQLMNSANATGYRLGTFCVIRVYAQEA
ncbi:MAG TPA: hypothetical protein VFN61_07275 [Acidimicrobiales bacterium]|nr:hypothetical protein [Acidimicrobiales bacterium]